MLMLSLMVTLTLSCAGQVAVTMCWTQYSLPSSVQLQCGVSCASVRSDHCCPVSSHGSSHHLDIMNWALIPLVSPDNDISRVISDEIKPFQFCLLSSATVRTDSKPISSPQDTSLFTRSLQWFNFPYLQFLLPQPQKRTFPLKIPSLSAQNKRKPSNTNTNRQLEY